MSDPGNKPAATLDIFDPLLQQVSERIECRTGLHFPRERFADLERGLAKAARETGFSDARAYAESLLNRDLHTADLEALAGSLTIGETHFFRDPGAFAFLETTLLPELISARRAGHRRLRIWSAGCATGEEPYSIAILLHRLIPDLADWHITILGTDINPKVLARAAAGIYSEWSFRDTPAWVKPRYFLKRSGGHYELQSWLKLMVSFTCLNLVDDVYPSILNNTNAMDLIICRNVLLYFTPSRIPQVVRRFHSALVDGGQLVLGAVEASQTTFPELTPVAAPGVALYRKNGAATLGTTIGDFSGPHKAVCPPSVRSPVIHSPAHLPREAISDLPVGRGNAFAEANTLYAAGRYREAREALLAGNSRKRDDDPRAAGLLAQCHANLGELAEALVCCDRAVAVSRTDPVLHFLRAGILQELQRDEEALLALRSVLFLDPGHVLAHFTMANLHRRRNRMSLASKHLANVRLLLANLDPGEELPQSGGLTVGRLSGMLAEKKEGTTDE